MMEAMNELNHARRQVLGVEIRLDLDWFPSDKKEDVRVSSALERCMGSLPNRLRGVA